DICFINTLIVPKEPITMVTGAGHGQGGSGQARVEIDLIHAIARGMSAIGIAANVEIESRPLDIIPVPHGILQTRVPGTADRERRGADVHIRPAAIVLNFITAAGPIVISVPFTTGKQ